MVPPSKQGNPIPEADRSADPQAQVRPLLGIALLALAVGGVVWLIRANRKKAQRQAQAGTAQAA